MSLEIDEPVEADIWHNIMWSKYKAAVFTEISKNSDKNNLKVNFYHIADTMSDRTSLSVVDYSAHDYKYEKLFSGSYSDISLLKLLSKITSINLRSNAAIVLLAGFERPEYWLLLLIAKIRNQKVGVFCDSTAYDNDQVNWKGVLKRLFFGMIDVAFCYGLRAREYMEMYGMPREKIFFRCQAAWLPPSYVAADIPDARIAARLDDAVPRLLYVGRLSPEKRVDALIHSFARLCRNDKMTLKIVGGGPEMGRLTGLANALGISDCVEFTGGLSGDALYGQYLAASALVLPSSSEPWGLVVNEALSYGCPVIVSDRCGCVPELVQEGLTGFSFSIDDELDLDRAISRTLEAFSETRATTQNCLRLISEFTPGHAANDILAGISATLAR